ncbi:uncharacterized protein L969DRAFT_79068 [Mixia osmundae IAM 14324]|uniref:Oxidoreductase n=1 Tax=Mixia osmundae (strain CBS 9802 / IAM 14324 / JCM 22182 / KY 12970) TaxID=764103 RepID=G7DS09_MIXOS|nr:uncharacterized protein L969DRAFT_79068 [Mixia osmundae IAM 14324]KEI37228.1 hypothetical protein L969DRAFT_79068 [Mixia osmundae IAM 14324]GAA93369.1 hypothetical protein E5Q_00009 [Mixia osmundae IAM 14324]
MTRREDGGGKGTKSQRKSEQGHTFLLPSSSTTMKQDNLNFKCALVTGGGGGIGRALAEYFLSKGKEVVIAGRTESNLKQTLEEIKDDKLSYAVLDTSKPETFEAFVADLLKKHDVDCLVNNAGIQKPIQIVDGGLDNLAVYDQEIATNIIGPVHLTQRLLPNIVKHKGVIYNVGSLLAYTGMVKCPSYNATKAYIHSWSIALRYQLESSGVAVAEIIPSSTSTALHRDHDDPHNNDKDKNPNAQTVEEFMADITKLIEAGEADLPSSTAESVVHKYNDAFSEGWKKLNGKS